MTIYDEQQTVAQTRQQYFADNQFGADGGYNARWIQMKLGPLPLALPNLAAHCTDARRHDVHHIATGYATDWRGEFEIAAWEIAAGLRQHYVGWALDLWALAVRLFAAPGAVWRAYLRGRQTLNLYQRDDGEAYLTQTVGALRRELGLHHPMRQARWNDRLCFAGWAAVSVGWTLLSAPLALTLFPLLGITLAILKRPTTEHPSGTKEIKS